MLPNSVARNVMAESQATSAQFTASRNDQSICTVCPPLPRCGGSPKAAALPRKSQKESPGTGGGPGLTGSRRAGGPGAGEIILRKALTGGCQHCAAQDFPKYWQR